MTNGSYTVSVVSNKKDRQTATEKKNKPLLCRPISMICVVICEK